MIKTLFFMLGIFFLTGSAEEPVSGKSLYPDAKVSRLIRVIDGDTFVCDIDEHSAIAGKAISIRIRHINTPELKSPDSDLRKAALAEKQRLSDLLSRAESIELKNLDRDKYFRIDADVYVDGSPLLPKLNQSYRLDNTNSNR